MPLGLPDEVAATKGVSWHSHSEYLLLLTTTTSSLGRTPRTVAIFLEVFFILPYWVLGGKPRPVGNFQSLGSLVNVSSFVEELWEFPEGACAHVIFIGYIKRLSVLLNSPKAALTLFCTRILFFNYNFFHWQTHTSFEILENFSIFSKFLTEMVRFMQLTHDALIL